MSKRKKILILGVTGQDGSFMAKLMHKKSYFVHGLVRKSSTGNLDNIEGKLQLWNKYQNRPPFSEHPEWQDLLKNIDSKKQRE